MAGTLTRWEPFAELAELRSRFDRMLTELGDGGGREWMPAIDVKRQNGQLVVRADVPGIKPEEIEVQVDEDMLTISGERREETKDKNHREFHYGAFKRAVALPAGAKTDAITASYDNGVLLVRVPLGTEEVSSVKIPIQRSE